MYISNGLVLKLLKPYIEGQLEIQDQSGKYLYRGEIKDIKIEEDQIIFQFEWLAKSDNFPPTGEWTKHDKLQYKATLQESSFSDVGNNRIGIFLPISEEIIVFFPPDGGKLDPTKVKGLQL